MPGSHQLCRSALARGAVHKDRITNAIYRAAVAVGGRDRAVAEGLADQVVTELEEAISPGHTPTVEEIQDVVERVLIHSTARTASILFF
jgi:uridine kinase